MPRDEPTYEQVREELVEVVRRLEQGGAPLDESLALWERAEALAAVCQARLDGARSRLDTALAARTGQEGEADDDAETDADA